MSISEALNYPFKNNNLLKILPIALAYGIILFLTNYGTIENNSVILCGGGLAMLAFTFMLAGYYISSLRRLQAGDENLPEVELSQNLKDGFLTVVAGFIYMLPAIIIIGIAVFFALSATDPAGDGGSGMGVLIMCGAIIGGMVLALALGAALQVGVVRYADEGTAGVLFDLPSNWGMVTSNFGIVLGLWWRTFVIGLISGVISAVLGAILGAMFPEQTSPFFEPTLAFWMVSAFINVAIYVISLFIGLAQYYLIYQFGLALGIGGNEKPKNDPYDL